MLQFEWVNHKKSPLYQSKAIAFKIKEEKLETLDNDGSFVVGYEVYIADDKLLKEWKPLRFFKNTDINSIRKWVEMMAFRAMERLVEDRGI